MIIQFSKMHGLGNDFMVVDQITQSVSLRPEQIRRLADRHTGVGFDQLLLVGPPQRPDADFEYRIFNADGSEVSQCGNGARCFALYVLEKKLTRKLQLRVQTHSGMIVLEMLDDGLIRVDMGPPRFTPDEVPVLAEPDELLYSVEAEGTHYRFAAVSMGNPHAVLLVDDIDEAPVTRVGALLECHPIFPERANIGFLQIVNRNFARLRVFERGVGETRACGTGACAAAVVGRMLDRLNANADIRLPGGTLNISWEGDGASVFMSGPATMVYEGQVRI